jgi:hypothetical protein
MPTEFSPQNDLEPQLIAAQAGQIPPEDFIRALLGSKVFMPVYEEHQIGGLQADSKANPLRIRYEQGDEVLVLFTSPERAKAFVRDYPGFGGGRVTEFTWIPEKLGVGYAIALNPGLPAGIDFEAQDAAQFAAMSGKSN